MEPRNIRNIPQSGSLYQRIAMGDGQTLEKCFDFCHKYGVDEPENRGDLAIALAGICIDNGEEALQDLAQIHPDAEFILTNATPMSLIMNDNGKEPYHNCSGCGGKCGGSHGMNDAGATAATAAPTTLAIPMAAPGSMSMDNLVTATAITLIGLGGIALLSVLIISATKK